MSDVSSSIVSNSGYLVFLATSAGIYALFALGLNLQWGIGTICLWRFVEENASAEIGYELHPDHQSQGILQEALVNILDFAENTLQLKQIDAYIHQDNIASRRLVERNGFLIDPVRIDENHEHNLIYIRTRDHAEKPV